MTTSDFTASIDWGDGTAASTGTVSVDGDGFKVSGSHTYSTFGSYPLAVSITQTGGDSATTSSIAQVLSSLRATGRTVNVLQGQGFSGSVATFVSANGVLTTSDFTASIDWGDGSGSSAGLITTTGQGFNVDSSHTYALAGAYPIRVTITDSTGKTTTTPGDWDATTAMSTERYIFASATGMDDHIYVFGGYSPAGVLHAAEVYDPDTRAWNSIPDMPQTRTYFAATAGGDGRIYVLGGYSPVSPYGILSSVDAFDPVTQSWDASPVADMFVGRIQIAATTGADGRIYVFGGSDDQSNLILQPEVYDPSNNTWTTLANMPRGRIDFSAVTGSDGRIYLLGGTDSGSNAIRAIDVYDPSSDTWTTPASMPSQKLYFGAATGPDGLIYLSGGYDSQYNITDTVEAFDPVASLWFALPNMSLGRAYGTAATADGRVYVLGGYGSDYQVSATVEVLSGVALVGDATLQATGQPIDAVEQDLFSGVVASFVSDEPIGNFTANINWGDGQNSDGLILANGSGFDVAGDHTYAAPGNFSVSVAIHQGSSVSVGTVSTALVHHLPQGTGAELCAVEGQPLTEVIVASFTGDPTALAADFSAIIDWGDNATSAGTVSTSGGGGFRVTGTHTYADEGVYPIRVTITDPRGYSTTTRGAWTSTREMQSIRYWHSAVTDADGRLYVLGGYDPNSFIDNVDAYDSTTDTWSTITQLPLPRSEFAATTGRDGRIYVLGGYDASYNVMNVAEAYDPVANTWFTLAPMPTARVDFTAVTGTDGRIYVMGGYDTSYNVLSGVDVFDPVQLTWSTAAGMLSPRVEFAASLGSDGRIYAMGGFDAGYNYLSSVEAYDPTSNAWTLAADMSVARVDLAATVGSDGRIYALGGRDPNVGYTNRVEAYDPSTNTWMPASSMSESRGYFAVATAGDGRLYAIGGYSNTGSTDSVEAFSIGAFIADAPLYATGSNISAVVGTVFTQIVASFTDENPGALVGDFTASIDWGDGQTTSGTIEINQDTDGFNVVGTHTYTSTSTNTITVTIFDIGGSQAEAMSIANVASITDTDGDGVLDAVEDGAPNIGDGNLDGIADRLQNDVASLPNSADASYVTLVSTVGNPLTGVAAIANPSPVDAPSGVIFPAGLFDFTVTNLPIAGSTNVILLLDNPLTLDTYYLYGKTADNANDHWYEFLFDGTTGAEFLQRRRSNDSSGPASARWRTRRQRSARRWYDRRPRWSWQRRVNDTHGVGVDQQRNLHRFCVCCHSDGRWNKRCRSSQLGRCLPNRFVLRGCCRRSDRPALQSTDQRGYLHRCGAVRRKCPLHHSRQRSAYLRNLSDSANGRDRCRSEYRRTRSV